MCKLLYLFFYLRRNSVEEIDYKKRHIFMITLGGKLIISSAIFSNRYYNMKWFSIFVSWLSEINKKNCKQETTLKRVTMAILDTIFELFKIFNLLKIT